MPPPKASLEVPQMVSGRLDLRTTRLMTTRLTDNSTHEQVDSRTSRLIDNSTYCNKTRAWYFFFLIYLFIFFKSLNLIFSCTEGSVESSRRNKRVTQHFHPSPGFHQLRRMIQNRLCSITLMFWNGASNQT